MKKLITLILISIFELTFSQTSIPAGNVSGTWTPAGSPYNINGSIMVAIGTTLNILPGTTVNFQGHYKFLIKGTLVAVGSQANNIIFTAANTTAGWYGIRIDTPPATQDSSLLKFCQVQYGIANGSNDDECGGGIFVKSFSKVNISNCQILSNNAVYGAGIYGDGADIIISNNTISSNTATSNGGGILIVSGKAVIKNNLVSSNNASAGGGISTGYNSTVTISSNTISSNTTVTGGAGLSLYSVGGLTNNQINNNVDNGFVGGGGIYINGPTSPISNNVISNNSATNGGAMRIHQSFPFISNNIIANNTSSNYGGGIFISLSANTPTITNNLMVNNSSGSFGGAIYFYGSSPSFINNTIANNNSGYGGGIACFFTSNPIIKNCIFSGNTATTDGAQVYLDDEPSDPNFVFCNIFGGTSAFGLNGNFYTGSYTNNINASPVFVSPSAGSGTGFNGLTANWSLQLTSPCINTGDPSGSYPSFDIAGNPRVTGGTIDMGAYEYSTITSIKPNGNNAQVVIYPNPFTTSTKIKLNKSISGQLIIYDQASQKVRILNVSTSNEIIIERGDLISGFYFFVLTSIEGLKYSGKLIIE